MQSSIEISKSLQNAQNNFSEIEKVIYGIIEFNFNDNLDDFSEKSGKIKKRKSEKSPKISNQKLHDSCIDPHTKEFMKSAILPSDKYWEIKQELGDKNDVDSKKINEAVKSVPFSLMPFPNSKFGHEGQKFIKIGSYVFVENTKISGLTRHLENTNIFFVVSPCNGYFHTLASGFKSEEDLMEQRKQLGKKYLADVITEVKQLTHIDTKVSCLVLGKREVQENMEAYDDAFFFMNREEEKEQHIEHYYLREEDSAANTDVDVYNIHAHGHEMDLATTDLETLHTLAEKTKKQAATDAIIVHCQQGMDRTGMLIFAFILYQNYDYYFTGNYKIERIYEAYKTLQWSRSPAALTKMADFVNAIYLAHALKAVDIEKQCRDNLDKLIPKNTMIADKKQELLVKINLAKSNSEKLEILEMELQQLAIMSRKEDYIQYESASRPESLSRNGSSSTHDSSGRYESSEKHEAPKKHDSQTRRPRPASCSLKEVTPLETFKKSTSEPDELHTHRSKLEGVDEKFELKVEKSKSSRLSGGLFKKTKKTTSDDLKAPDSLHQRMPVKKKDVLITNYPDIGELTIISELSEVDSSADKDKAEPDIKQMNTVTPKAVKHSSGLFSLRNRKRQSDSLKQSEVQNPLSILITELTCLANVIQHRKQTEDVLQHRIHPKVETEFVYCKKI